MGDVRPFSVKLGFFDVETVEYDKTRLHLMKGSVLSMSNRTQIGRGCKVYLGKHAIMEMGTNSTISASTSIRVYKRLTIGKDCRISWQCQIMDNNMHIIEYEDERKPDASREIIIGDKVWIASRSMIMPGTVIPSGCIVGGGAVVKGHKFEEKTILAGNPAVSVRIINDWEF